MKSRYLLILRAVESISPVVFGYPSKRAALTSAKAKWIRDDGLSAIVLDLKSTGKFGDIHRAKIVYENMASIRGRGGN